MEFYTIITDEGQTIWDIAIQEYGDVHQVWTLKEDNPAEIPDLNQDLTPATKLKIRVSPEVSDKELMNHFRTNQIKVNCRD